MTNRRLFGIMLLFAIAISILAAGCEQSGPAERTGKQIDRAIGDLKDAAKRATQ